MKKKKILIIILPIILILVIGAALSVLYFMTDMFKSNSILFKKYFSQTGSIVDIIKNQNSQEQQEFKKNNTYTMIGNLTTTVQDGTNSQEIKMTTAERHDTNTGRTYSELTLKNENMDTLKVSYINSEDIYAVKCEDIIPNYIGFRNNELKNFAQKMGITNINNIPDKVDLSQISKIANLTDEQKTYITNTYSKVILDSISEENYTKLGKTDVSIEGVSYETNAYQVTVGAETLKQMIVNCLTTLKDDNTTLVVLSNKLTSLGVANEITDITKLSEEIGKMITQVQKMNINNINITIVVYENKGKTIRTEFIVEQKEEQKIESITNTIQQETGIVASIDNLTTSKLTIDRPETMNTSKAILSIEQSKANRTNNSIGETTNNNTPITTMSQIILEKSTSDTETTNEMTIIPDTNNTAQFIMMNTTIGKANDTMNNSSEVTLSISHDGINTQTIQSVYTQSIEKATKIDEIQELKNSNTVIINNYTKEQLTPFLTKVGEKISQVIPDKIAQLGIDILAPSNNSANSTSIIGVNDQVAKIAEIVATSGISIANANGLEIENIAAAGTIGLGVTVYSYIENMMGSIVLDAQEKTNQLKEAEEKEKELTNQMTDIIENSVNSFEPTIEE